MSDEPDSQPTPSREDELSGLFAHLVLQQSNMAMMLLGKVAHPETGQIVKNVDSAKLFIDQLEMLEVKTKGNLRKEEEVLLKQSLMSLHLAFVDAVQAPAAEEQAAPGEAPKPKSPPASEPNVASSSEEHRVKFTKKY